jgi:hypothetical protein
MKKLLFIPILFVLILSACKKDNLKNNTNPHIEHFYFNEHNKIKGIETIKFTVDTIAGLIYNEDSASFNCNFSRVLPVPDVYETLSSISINGNVWNYMDTINMNSPITINTVSGNKKRSATYKVRINKHTVEPDSIVWTKSLINESNITSINSGSYNGNVYLFFTNSNGETKIYSSNTSGNFTQIHSQTDLSLNFYKAIIKNEKSFVSSLDNQSLYFFDLSNIASGFSTISLPENSEIIDIWGILNNKLYATIKSDALKYMSFDGTAWAEESCNMLDELSTIGSAKISSDNSLFVISGSINDNLTNNVLATQDGNYWINTINQADTLLYEPVKNACVVDYYDYFYLFGGINKDGATPTCYYSKNDGYSWSTLKSYQRPSNDFTAKENMAACALNDYIFMFNCNSASNIEIWKGRINKADFIRK